MLNRQKQSAYSTTLLITFGVYFASLVALPLQGVSMTLLAIQLRRRVRGETPSCTRVSVCALADMEDESSTERDSDTEAWTHSEPRQ